MTRNWLALALAALALVPCTGCVAPVLVAGAAAGATFATDKRTTGAALDDQAIELKAGGEINSDDTLKDAHISITSYNRVVLLTGQIPAEELRGRVIAHLNTVDKVRSIHDALAVGPAISMKQRGIDSLTTAKVKSRLLGEQGLPSVHIKVVTENNVVYLMGMARRNDAQYVARIVQQVDGVDGVVLVIEYLD
ncbi:MAG: BON domain-containing protein [Gammaproteobacteria bacterium]|nr:BON domain-containing protein [Gammaproteobacteria bacterium]